MSKLKSRENEIGQEVFRWYPEAWSGLDRSIYGRAEIIRHHIRDTKRN